MAEAKEYRKRISVLSITVHLKAIKTGTSRGRFGMHSITEISGLVLRVGQTIYQNLNPSTILKELETSK